MRRERKGRQLAEDIRSEEDKQVEKSEVDSAEDLGGAQEAQGAGEEQEAGAAADEQVAELTHSLEAAQQQRDDYKDALIRERADFENYKKRNAALSAESYDRGVQAAVGAVLPVLDNFERALASESTDQKYADGMAMILRQFQSALEGLGVQEIETSGAFDPAYHHAVMQSEEEGVPTNQITETLQKGYAIRDKVVRPAMVKVNK